MISIQNSRFRRPARIIDDAIRMFDPQFLVSMLEDETLMKNEQENPNTLYHSSVLSPEKLLPHFIGRFGNYAIGAIATLDAIIGPVGADFLGNLTRPQSAIAIGVSAAIAAVDFANTRVRYQKIRTYFAERSEREDLFDDLLRDMFNRAFNQIVSPSKAPIYRQTLGVSDDASDDDIKKAFRDLSMQYHPDRNPGDEDAARKYKGITEAYMGLTQPVMERRED